VLALLGPLHDASFFEVARDDRLTKSRRKPCVGSAEFYAIERAIRGRTVGPCAYPSRPRVEAMRQAKPRKRTFRRVNASPAVP
jgi:hypothetical protein